MYPLLETIRFENGVFSNPEYHFRRMKQSVKTCFGQSLQFDPEKVLREALPAMENKQGLFKFRLLYGNKHYQWEFVPYKLPVIKALKPVVANSIEYQCKFTDRSSLNNLRQLKGKADDVLIIKNGEVTDTSFANIVFYDGSRWVTPKNPLLKGTRRAALLDAGLITEASITPNDLSNFKAARIINAMIELEDAVETNVTIGQE